MPLANIAQYWSTDGNSPIPFYPNVFTRDRFTQIFWMLHLKTITPRAINVKTRLGKFSFIIYNPHKPTKWGIRMYVLCDAESWWSPDLPVITRIPLHLYKMLLNSIPGAQGHHMFTDRYYTSLVLAEELYKMKCHLTGTIQTNRKGMPFAIK